MQRIMESLMKRQTFGPIVMDICELIKIQGPKRFDEVRGKQKKLSEVTDMIHAAHVFHRTVSVGNISHKNNTTTINSTKDDVLSLLVGDYLLAQSSVDMASLRHPRTVGLIAKGLEDYTAGEFLKLQLIDSLHKNNLQIKEIQDTLRKYAELTCGSLLSNACLSAALIAGHTIESDRMPSMVKSFGLYTGSAQRFIEMLYCPNDNDRNFVSQLPLSSYQLDSHIRHYLDKSSDTLQSLPEGRSQSSLSAMLCRMRQYSPR